ncbi:alpha/beta hydrolase [Arhodomonas sp. SL1]|uniref:alpha/beta hydrolase n=1 Tax=Arhodomonas sp. SL1 TaxID=3425691 RepID=UPI003F8827E6
MYAWVLPLVAAPALAAAGVLGHARLRAALAAPRVPVTASLAEHGLPGRTVQLPTRRGRQLEAWLIPGRSGKGIAVITHGWGANRELMLPLARPLHEAGWTVLAFDARNHGNSDDDTFSSMPRFAEDIDAAVAWLRGPAGYGDARLALIGHSVGAAATLLAAARREDVARVVSLSSFAHPEPMMRRWLAEKGLPFFPLGWYVLRYVERVIGHRFDDIAPVRTIRRIRCPVLLAHGQGDTVIPPTDLEAIWAAAGDAEVQVHWLPGGHDASAHINDHVGALIRFLDHDR